MSLDTALTRAELESPLLRRAQAEHDVVAARKVEASMWLPGNPIASVAVGPRREESGQAGTIARGAQVALRAEQTIEIAGQRGARLDVVGQALEIERARRDLARNETRARVRTAYIAGLLARAQLESSAARQDLAARLYDSTRARVEAGAASEIELRLAEVERGRVARERIDFELALGDVLSSLRALVGVPPEQPLLLTTPLARPITPLPDVPTALAAARAHRSELKMLQRGRQRLDADLIRLRREAIPNPTVFVEFQRDLPGQVYWGGGLSLALPLARRNQGPIAVARAERAAIDSEEVLTDRSIGLEVARVRTLAASRREQVRILADEVVPAAEANARLVIEGWRAGKFDVFRVIQASRETWEAQRGYFETLGASWQSQIELDRVMGTP